MFRPSFERREVKNARSKKLLPCCEEIDDDEIVNTGTENFAQAVKEFGYDEEQLEGRVGREHCDC